MKINQPVTQQELPFPKGHYLVSMTDMKGVTTSVNDQFIKQSGFTREELIGSSHNIIRHPDMPPQAFEDLWRTIKQSKPWRGLVKNRAKSGDYYWVDAFVVPVRKGGQIVGYMSVRTEPTREQIRGAEQLYRQLMQTGAAIKPAGGLSKLLSLRTRLAATMSLSVLLVIATALIGLNGIQTSNKMFEQAFEEYVHEMAKDKTEAMEKQIEERGKLRRAAATAHYNDMVMLSIAVTVVSLLIMLIASQWLAQSIIRPIRNVILSFNRISEGILTDEQELTRHDEFGELYNSLTIMQVNLKVMLDNIREATEELHQHSANLDAQMFMVVKQSELQFDRIQSSAATTEESSQAVAEVAALAVNMKNSATASQSLVVHSNQALSGSMEANKEVVSAVHTSEKVISKLSRRIEKINDITKAIKEIADQTNLLALNAAIEAARAGESGRGFAVVADEVRKLSLRTAQSTVDISTMVTEIRSGADEAVTSMHHAVEEVNKSVVQMQNSVSNLAKITESSKAVALDSQNISEFSREQATIASHLAQNMEEIAALVEQNMALANDTSSLSAALSRTAADMRKLIGSFKLIVADQPNSQGANEKNEIELF